VADVSAPVGIKPGERICVATELIEGARGLRFLVNVDGGAQPAFAIRHGGRAYAYLNRCAHKGVELDWVEGEFFDRDGLSLVCATHGARYDPASGRCTGGPCAGRGLRRLAVVEQDGDLRLDSTSYPTMNE
jgi:nitrite reductase/ring-hydroxylating ferredoxin subunit